MKRAPKEAPTHKFAQDDIDEHKPSSDINYEWGHEYGSAPELANSDGYAHLTTPSTSAASTEPTVVTSGSVPKTFKAETVSPSENSETARKLSTVSGEFRPITDDLSASSPPSGNKSSPAASAEVTTPEDGPEESSKSSSVNKRKRRKRSVMKKKTSPATTSHRKNSEAGEASDTSASMVWESATSILSGSGKAGAEVVLFTMDDVDGPQV